MILTALTMAGALAASAPGADPAPSGNLQAPGILRVQGQLPPIAERTPNLYKVPDRCKDAPVKVVDRFGRPVAQKLGDLPKGALIYAVDRREDGCPVLVVAYGTPMLDNPNPTPPKDVTPVRREDAPSNRR